MLLIYCPHCQEEREEEEFNYAGEADIRRPDTLNEISDEVFGQYLYFKDNTRGLYKEMWVHTMACRKYFNVFRNTQTYQILGSEKLNETSLTFSKNIAQTQKDCEVSP